MEATSSTECDVRTIENTNQIEALENKPAPNRMKRAKLSCLECRRKKLSCDRNWPCNRCVRSRRANRCSFEDGPEVSAATLGDRHLQDGDITRQITRLQNEVSQLRAVLVDVKNELKPNEGVPYSTHSIQDLDSRPQLSMRTPEVPSNANVGLPERAYLNTTAYTDDDQGDTSGNNFLESNYRSIEPQARYPRIYYSRHVLFKFFSEMPTLFPLMRETIEEWIKPLGIQMRKDKPPERAGAVNIIPWDHEAMQNLLPPKEDVNVLVSFYLDKFEQLHRIVHIPTFKKEYDKYWMQNNTRCPAMTTLLLAICSLSASSITCDCLPGSLTMRYRSMHKQWLSACDSWLAQTSQKYRKLVHHQIACIVYLSKRVNMIDKKTWWTLSASMVQDAIMDGLHCEPPSSDPPFVRELKRRIWTTVRELDLQNSFEFGLPSLLHTIDADVAAPANLNDEDLNESSDEVLPASPPQSYAQGSYQYHSSRNWHLRLEISQRLSSTRLPRSISYDDVLRYTHLITQAMSELPSCPGDEENLKPGDPRILIHIMLRGQLQDCLLGLHRPYLNKKEYSLSETISYNVAQDILTLHKGLANTGLVGVSLLREDLLLASLTIIRIALSPPQNSSTTIPANAQSAIESLEHVLPLIKERVPRRSAGGHWGLLTLYGAITLLKIRGGIETRESAKAAIARRVLDAHYKYFGTQDADQPNQPPQSRSHVRNQGKAMNGELDTVSNECDTMASNWLDDTYREFDYDFLDLDIGMEGPWDDIRTV